jgi:hypothetical protein
MPFSIRRPVYRVAHPMGMVSVHRGNWPSALSHAQASYRLEAETSNRGTGVGTFFRQMAYVGDHSGAAAMLHGGCLRL